MYDHIRLQLPHTFEDDTARKEFCERYLMYEEVKQLRSYNNGAFKDLKQNRGVYIKLRVTEAISKQQSVSGKQQEMEAKITMSFSLHKFYNFCTLGEYLNWDDFTWWKANRAKTLLLDFFPMLDFSRAKVTTYEVGINIQLPQCPDEYFDKMRELQVKERTYPVIHDRHEKEYKQYGTTTKGKRISYVWYNKTFEARSKMRSNLERYVVPENIMRCEKDNRIPMQQTMFFDLFKKDFQKLTANEFRKRFMDDIFFVERVPKLCQNNLPELSKPKLELLKEILSPPKPPQKGGCNTECVLARLERDYRAGKLPKRTYYRRVAEVKEVAELIPHLPKDVQDEYIDYEREYKEAVREKMEAIV